MAYDRPLSAGGGGHNGKHGSHALDVLRTWQGFTGTSRRALAARCGLSEDDMQRVLGAHVVPSAALRERLRTVARIPVAAWDKPGRRADRRKPRPGPARRAVVVWGSRWRLVPSVVDGLRYARAMGWLGAEVRCIGDHEPCAWWVPFDRAELWEMAARIPTGVPPSTLHRAVYADARGSEQLVVRGVA